jgi:hypothetical protein
MSLFLKNNKICLNFDNGIDIRIVLMLSYLLQTIEMNITVVVVTI